MFELFKPWSRHISEQWPVAPNLDFQVAESEQRHTVYFNISVLYRVQDGDGWQYGTNWSSKHWRASPMMVLDVVRRRKWTIKYTLNYVGQALVLTFIIKIVSLRFCSEFQKSLVFGCVFSCETIISPFLFTSSFNKNTLNFDREIFLQKIFMTQPNLVENLSNL